MIWCDRKHSVHRMRNFKKVLDTTPPVQSAGAVLQAISDQLVSRSHKNWLLFFIEFPPSCTEPHFTEDRKPAPNTQNWKVRQTFLCQPTGKHQEGEVLVVLIWGTILCKHRQGWVKVTASALVWGDYSFMPAALETTLAFLKINFNLWVSVQFLFVYRSPLKD